MRLLNALCLLAVLLPLSACQFLTGNAREDEMARGFSPDELVGPQWVVEDIADQGMIDASRVTLNFDASGRVYGNASCNGYSGQYKQAGDAWTFSQLITTKKMCPKALMEQEQRFTAVLSQVDEIRRDASGALILLSPQGHRIVARVQTP